MDSQNTKSPTGDRRLATAVWALVAVAFLSLAFEVFAYFNSFSQWKTTVEEINDDLPTLTEQTQAELDKLFKCAPCDFNSLSLEEQIESATAIVITKNFAPIHEDRIAPVVTEVLRKPDDDYSHLRENSVMVTYQFSKQMVAEEVEGLLVLYAGDPPREMRALRYFDDRLNIDPEYTLDAIRAMAAQ